MANKVIETKKVKVQAKPAEFYPDGITPQKTYDAICDVTEVESWNEDGRQVLVNIYRLTNDWGSRKRFPNSTIFRQVNS